MQRTSGKIAEFNQADRTVTLEGGQTFIAGTSVDMTKVKAGAVVTITYDAIASSIELGDVQAPPAPVKPMPAPKSAVNTTATLKKA